MAHHAEVYAQEGSAHAEATYPESPREAPPSRPPAPSTPSAPSFLLMTGASVLALVFGMIGACLALNLFEDSSQKHTSAGEHTAQPAPRSNRDAEVKALKSQLAAVTEQVGELKHRLEALPKPEPSSGVAILQGQVADLTKAAREAAPLPSQILRVQEQLAKLSEDILSLRHEVGDVQLRLGKHEPAPVLPPAIAAPASAHSETPPPPVSTTVVEPPASDTLSASAENDEPVWKRAVGLYKKGRYKDALAAFDKLELTRPDDARVWYYAALSRGFTTNQWTGGTEDLAARGVDREQAGTPSSDEIDRSFDELTTATGKDWLAAYRARVKKP